MFTQVAFIRTGRIHCGSVSVKCHVFTGFVVAQFLSGLFCYLMNHVVCGHALNISFFVVFFFCQCLFYMLLSKVFFFFLPDKVTTFFRSTSVVLEERSLRWETVKSDKTGCLNSRISLSLPLSLLCIYIDIYIYKDIYIYTPFFFFLSLLLSTLYKLTFALYC